MENLLTTEGSVSLEVKFNLSIWTNTKLVVNPSIKDMSLYLEREGLKEEMLTELVEEQEVIT